MRRKNLIVLIALTLGSSLVLPMLPSASAADTQTRVVNWRADKDALPARSFTL